MPSKSGSKPRSPRRGSISLLQNYVIVKIMLKTMWGERRPNVVILEYFVCRWEGGEAEKVEG